MEHLNEDKTMTEGLSVADAMALNKDNNGFGDQVWPLVWLAALGGNGNGILGGRNDGAAGVTVAGIEGLQNQINGLLNTINANTSVLQHDAVKQQLCNMGTLIQSGNADITHAISECCCKTQAAICDLGYKMQDGNKDIINAICAQTQVLTLQHVNGQQAILEAVRREGEADRALINANTLNEKDEKLTDCRTQLSENRIEQKVIEAIKASAS
jgi:hypothetical protein